MNDENLLKSLSELDSKHSLQYFKSKSLGIAIKLANTPTLKRTKIQASTIVATQKAASPLHLRLSLARP